MRFIQIRCPTPTACVIPKKTIFGIYEEASLVNLKNLKVKALIDTGATTTALDASEIRMYMNRQGKRWVYYDFIHRESGTRVSMHQPVNRVIRVITHKGPPAERPVVGNTIKVGKQLQFVETSLINRSNFPQQLLIGRNFLSDTVLVDSARTYLQSKADKE